ncbi:MAG: hypothetical protein KA713_02415 [Chryseotalea sp. WA131a]|jgi:hypothetical protein|nr:MAG: hypothetical protein KA713_02415 [Chryseotalea sp. WA131a]
MKNFIIGITIVFALASCETKEKAVLQQRIDSLSIELNNSKDAEKNLNEVGMLIDSIDASRKTLQLKMVEGTSYSDYISRLKNINAYVQQTEAKLSQLEKSNKNATKSSASSIRRLKADLANRTNEILDLELKLANQHNQNLVMWAKLNSTDSLLSLRDETIKLNERDIVSLEKLLNETQSENKIAIANLYFAQAEALEKAANRTHFAPRKKKETRREALELYRLSLSMGNMKAQNKIDELEKKLG